MKFLVLSQPIPGLTPPEDRASFFKDCLDYLNATLDEGVLDCTYITPDGGGMAIVNAASHEELWERTNAFPATPFLKLKFLPLLDHNHFYNQVIEGHLRGAG